MPIPRDMIPQTDFSAGQLDVQMKRTDNPVLRQGARQMANMRVLNSRRMQQRPGRRARILLPSNGRVDEVRVATGLVFRLFFANDNTMKIYDDAGALVTSNTGLGWNASTIDEIVWTPVRVTLKAVDIVVTFQGVKPLVAHYNAGWTFSSLTFAQDGIGAELVPYFRLADRGITLKPSGTSGSVTLLASAAVFNAQHVNAFIRFANRRLHVTAFTDSTHVTATWIEPSFPNQVLTVGAITGLTYNATDGFQVGQIVEGDASSTVGEIVSINAGANQIHVQSISTLTGYNAGEILIGPTSRAQITALTTAAATLEPAVTWDEQMVSDARGWPQSCATDQGRLIFTDLPQTPNAILWGSLTQPYDFTIGAQPTDAFVELLAGNPRIYHVFGGLQEIVFTDKGVYYIPISETNPLKPGSVVFREITPDPASSVRPLNTADAIIYVNAGRTRLVGILPTGSVTSTKPYLSKDLTELHSALFNAPKGMAISSGDDQFPERYLYVVNGDGTVVVGRYQQDATKDIIGWVPWNGTGVVNWVSALQSVVTFTTNYPGGVPIVETIDDTTFLDAAVAINAVPAALTPPGGDGPLFWLPGQNVQLTDGNKSLGLRGVDASGFIIPIGGEDLSAVTIIAGFFASPTFEPYIPQSPGGASKGQRQKRRRMPRVAVSVENSTGFVFVPLYSGPQSATLPVPGTLLTARERRIPQYKPNDNPALPPLLRENTEEFRPLGRTSDPRVAIIKDLPGPLRIIEFGAEASV